MRIHIEKSTFLNKKMITSCQIEIATPTEAAYSACDTIYKYSPSVNYAPISILNSMGSTANGLLVSSSMKNQGSSIVTISVSG